VEAWGSSSEASESRRGPSLVLINDGPARSVQAASATSTTAFRICYCLEREVVQRGKVEWRPDVGVRRR
jgi:hypothetical protein